MPAIVRLALTSLAAARLKDSASRAITYAALLAVTGVIAITGLGFCLSALWIFLAQLYGPLNASAIIGGGLVVIAIIVYLYAGYTRRRRARTPSPLPDFDRVSMPTVTGPNMLAAAIVAVGIGYVTGRLMTRK